MAVGQVLRGMQRAGGEGWTAVGLLACCVAGEGAGAVLRVCAALCRLLEQACVGRKNTTVKGFNVLNRIWG